jgi:hypothetical protein
MQKLRSKSFSFNFVEHRETLPFMVSHTSQILAEHAKAHNYVLEETQCKVFPFVKLTLYSARSV